MVTKHNCSICGMEPEKPTTVKFKKHFENDICNINKGDIFYYICLPCAFALAQLGIADIHKLRPLEEINEFAAVHLSAYSPTDR